MRFILPALLIVCACGPGPSHPIPLVGVPEDLSALAGRWSGSYEADGGGRSGTVVFELQAGADTAYGDVVMVPIAWTSGGEANDRVGGRLPEVTPPRPLAIRFVRVSGDLISGRLEPYHDPECGCHLRTLFEGRLEGDRLRGTYTSYHEESGRQVTGRWWVERQSGS